MLVKTVLALSLALVTATSAFANTPNINQQVNFKVNTLAHNIDLNKADEVYNTIISRLGDSRMANHEGVFYSYKQDDNILNALDELNSVFNGQYGVALIGQEGLLLLKDTSAFPLMSTIKMMLAYAVAQKINENGDALVTKFNLKLSDFNPNTYSPIYQMIKGVMENQKDPHLNIGLNVKPGFISKLEVLKQVSNTIPQDANIEITLADLIYFSVRYSDNNAFDYLLNNYLNGPQELEQFLQSKGIKSAQVKVGEVAMSQDVNNSYLNNMTAYDAAKVMALFERDENINVEVRDLINSALLNAPSGIRRIQAGVSKVANSFNPPIQYQVYNKTGLGPMNKYGERIALNDLAYVIFDNKPYIIAIYSKDLQGDAKSTIAQGESGISKVSEIIFKFLSKQQ